MYLKNLIQNKVVNNSQAIQEHKDRITNTEVRIDEILKKYDSINAEFTELKDLVNNDKYFELKKLLKDVEPYQPIWGLNILESTKRSCDDRCNLIYEKLENNVKGLKILDVGSSLGYVSSYFASKGASVEGWEYNEKNYIVSNLSKALSGLNVNYLNKTFNLETVSKIQEGDFDVVLILSVIHHTINEIGLDNVKSMLKSLFDKVPLVIFELAQKDEDKSLYWNEKLPENQLDIFENIEELEIVKLGEFTTHLSDKKRPLIAVSKKNIRVNDKYYLIKDMSFRPYKNSIIPTWNRYYWTQDYFIKVRHWQKTGNNKIILNEQAINELNFYLENKNSNNSLPKLIDFEIKDECIIFVFEKIDGVLLWDVLPILSFEQKMNIIDKILLIVDDLKKMGIYHNDLRTWNILLQKETLKPFLIDFGLASRNDLDKTNYSILWLMWSILGNKKLGFEYAKPSPPKLNEFEEIVPNKYLNEIRMLTKKYYEFS